MKKFVVFNFIFILLFAAFVIFNIVKSDKEYSPLENRYLEKKPSLTAEGIMDRSFMEKAESYSNDQLMFRDFLLKLKAEFERLLGEKENNGVYFAKDGYLISKPSESDDALIDKNIDAIKKLSGIERFSVSCCIIPEAFEILKDKLPEDVYFDDVEKVISRVNDAFKGSNVNNFDVKGKLIENKDGYIFYRTDHHQTSEGSYIVYKALGNVIGYEPLAAEEFTVETVSDNFLGTTYSKGLVRTEEDTIKVYKTGINERATVEFYGEGKESESMFFPEHLLNKDKYSYFLDGNHGLTVVKNGAENERKLAVFKDSYAHALAPFFINHFSSVHFIDMRYFNEDPIKYITENGITEILVLYGTSTFMTDENIEKIGEYSENSPYAHFGLVKESKEVGNSYFSDAVFLGDSLTLGFQSYSGISEAAFLCRTALSVGGVFNIEDDGTSLIDKVKAVNPKKIYVMLGANELITMGNKDVVMDKYRMVIDALKKDNPEALIYMQSVIPVSEEKEQDGKIKNYVIRSFNETLQEITKEKEVYFLDVQSAVTDERGYLLSELTVDGVHLGAEGCAIWAGYIKKHTLGGEEYAVDAFAQAENGFEKGVYDLEKIAEDLKMAAGFEGGIAYVQPETILLLHGVDRECVKNVYGLAGGGATAEEIALFEVESEEDAIKVKAKIEEYIEARRKSFESYIPKEIPKIDSAVLFEKNNLIALVIAEDIKNTEEILEEKTSE